MGFEISAFSIQIPLVIIQVNTQTENMFQRNGVKFSLNRFLGKKKSTNRSNCPSTCSNQDASTADRLLSSDNEKIYVSNEKVRRLSSEKDIPSIENKENEEKESFCATELEVANINDSRNEHKPSNVNEAINLVKKDEVKRRIDDARWFFGQSKIDLDCYSINISEVVSESSKKEVKQISDMNAEERPEHLIESSHQEKRIFFHNTESKNETNYVNLEMESIVLQNKNTSIMSMESSNKVKEEIKMAQTKQGIVAETLNDSKRQIHFLIIDRKFENMCENQEIANELNISFKETTYLVEDLEDNKGSI